MLVLDVSTNLGPAATLAELEEIIRGLRVAADVAYDAEVRRIRRAVSEQMKYPTDTELQNARNRLSGGGQDSPGYRAGLQLAAREILRSEGRLLPPETWTDYSGWARLTGSPLHQALSDAGYDRLAVTGVPVARAAALDILDPVLYDALVADGLARLLPQRVGVRTLR